MKRILQAENPLRKKSASAKTLERSSKVEAPDEEACLPKAFVFVSFDAVHVASVLLQTDSGHYAMMRQPVNAIQSHTDDTTGLCTLLAVGRQQA